MGYRATEYPCIETAYLATVPRMESEPLDVVAFTSRRGVRGFAGLNQRLSGSTRIAVVGRATGQAVREILERTPDIAPEESGARALARAICGAVGQDQPSLVLHVRGTLAAPTFREALEAAGHRVFEWTVYQTRIATPARLTGQGPSIIVLASPSAVDGFLANNPAGDPRFRYVTIGPETTRRLLERGVTDYREAAESTVQGLAQAVQTCMNSLRS
jgi:uroporphyrinogen-III synthase